MPSQEHTATQKEGAVRAVSSTPAVGFAGHFFAAMVHDGLAYPPEALQPQEVLFTRGFAVPNGEPRDSQ